MYWHGCVTLWTQPDPVARDVGFGIDRVVRLSGVPATGVRTSTGVSDWTIVDYAQWRQRARHWPNQMHPDWPLAPHVSAQQTAQPTPRILGRSHTADPLPVAPNPADIERALTQPDIASTMRALDDDARLFRESQ